MKHLFKSAIVAATMLATAGPSLAEEYSMNAVTLAPRQAAISQGFVMFVDEVNEKFKGEFQIKWRGGPEVMPPFKQAEAVRGGAMDMAFTSPSYYSGLVPSSSTMNLSFKRYDEINATDYHERMAELHAEKDLVLLGEVPATDLNFLLYLRDPITGLDDLKGKRIRVFPTLLPLIESLGAEPIVLPMGEIFTAMERGAIDGFMQGPIGNAKQFEGVVGTVVYPGVYRAGFPILVNKRKWEAIPEDLRDRITTFVRDDLAPRIDQTWADDVAKGVEEMDAAGFDRYQLSAEDEATYRQKALDAAWAVIAEKAGEDVAGELKAMLVD